MRYICRIIIFILINLNWEFNAYAQKETNNWYFGTYVGISFNNGSPIALSNSAMDAWAGCASISDNNGNLLFYSDGRSVWNRNHTVMPNGSGLLGGWIASQNGVIIPLPGSSNIYYVFTVAHFAQSDGLRYSIVNMNLDGGLGDVTAKNISLLSPCCEKITAVKHSNNSGVWIITHLWNSDAFYAFYLDRSGLKLGINNPVITHIGSIHDGGLINSRGYLKASPDGTLLTSSNATFNEIFHFDNKTGIVSDPIRIKYLNNDFYGYGVEFSPNGRLLYLNLSSIYYHCILQYNVSIYSASSINNSCKVLNSSTTIGYMALQVAVDGKIYVAKWMPGHSTYLDIINNPNDTGINSHYISDGIYIHLTNSIWGMYGLPTFMQSYFFVPDFKAEQLCFGDTTKFALTSIIQIDSIIWNFGNPSSGTRNISKLFNSKHKYTDTGLFNVKVIVFHLGHPDTFSRQIKITLKPFASFTVADTNQCLKGNQFVFINHSTIPYGSMSYTWDFGDTIYSYDTISTNHSYKWDKTYKIQLTALSDYGCSSTYTKQVIVNPMPITSFSINDSTQCLKSNKFIFNNQSRISKNTPLTYFWTFGNGTTSTLKYPFCTYSSADSFPIKLITTSNLGCTDTFSRTAIIYPQANPVFSVNDSVQCLKGNSFSFSDQTASFPTINNRLWKFGDSKTDTSLSALHQFLASGTFPVSLITTTSDGCKDTAKKKRFCQSRAGYCNYSQCNCSVFKRK